MILGQTGLSAGRRSGQPVVVPMGRNGFAVVPVVLLLRDSVVAEAGVGVALDMLGGEVLGFRLGHGNECGEGRKGEETVDAVLHILGVTGLSVQNHRHTDGSLRSKISSCFVIFSF